MTTVFKNADYWSSLDNVLNLCKHVVENYDVLITTKNRQSTSYIFTFIPNHTESTRALRSIKDCVKGTKFRVKLQGRAGINGPHRRGFLGNHNFVPLAEATRMDVYVYVK